MSHTVSYILVNTEVAHKQNSTIHTCKYIQNFVDKRNPNRVADHEVDSYLLGTAQEENRKNSNGQEVEIQHRQLLERRSGDGGTHGSHDTENYPNEERQRIANLGITIN